MDKQKNLSYLFIFILIFVAQNSFAQQFLNIPIEGVYRKDYVIVNYVDWQDTGILDSRCGSKTYDGHQGTDFTIRSFKQMDSGVNVLAAADGKVTFIKDGEFDRETVSDVSKGLGNYIAIEHPNKYYSYYGHLKKNSLKVKNGDFVKQGQIIAQIGSSGNSTDAHLHFELYYDSLYVVDPFSGSCGNQNSLWNTELAYDSNFSVWETGMRNKLVNINNLREREISLVDNKKIFPQNSTKPVLFWAHLIGLRKDSTLNITWKTPNGQVWFQFDITFKKDWWYYYYWTYIDNKDLEAGNWTAELKYNNRLVHIETFEVQKNSSINSSQVTLNSPCSSILSMNIPQLEDLGLDKLTLRTIQGQRIEWNTAKHLKPNIYILEYKNNNGLVCRSKRVL